MKTYSKLHQENKDILYIINYAKDCKIYFLYTYSSISNTYTGLKIDSYIETVRGFLTKHPDFLEVCNDDIKNWLDLNGYTEVKKTLWGSKTSN